MLAFNLPIVNGQDQGYRCTSKSLEEVVKETKKKKARLIGYDETPTILSPELHDSNLQEDSNSDLDFKVRPLNEMPQRNSSTKHKDVARQDSSLGGAPGSKPGELHPVETTNHGVLNSDSKESGKNHDFDFLFLSFITVPLTCSAIF